jgi:hypothetical protein
VSTEYQDPQAQQIISRWNSLKTEQTNFRTLWDDAANYIMPRKGQIVSTTSPGQSQTIQLYDTTAEESALVFGAGLLAQLVPPGEVWMRFEPSNPNASEVTRAWYSECTDRAIKAVYASNFYLAIHEDFLDAGIFGPSCTYVEEGKKRLLNFVHIPVGSFYCCEDNEGAVDTMFRDWKWTAAQAMQQWPNGKFGKQLAAAASASDPKDKDRKFTFIHAIYPRQEHRSGEVEGKLRPIASCYVCLEDQNVIEEGGFYEMPAAVSRLLRSNNEVYGRGPGIQVLPEIKLVNRMELDLLLALEQAVKPGWLMPDDSAYRPDNRPDGITYWDASNPNNRPERLQSNARIDLGEQKTEQKRQRIRSAFFVDMFQMLSNASEMKREKTAFEVAQMVQEKLILFSPMFARLTQEKLNPLLERVFNIMFRAGMFPPPPEEAMQDGGYEIVYVSKIALAIKAAQNGALMEMLQLCTEMANFDQSVPMVVKWREAFRDVARNRGTPQDWMRTDEEVDAMVAQMQEAQAAMQQAQTAEMAAGAVQKLGPAAQEKAAKALSG